MKKTKSGFPLTALLCSCLFLGAGQGILINCLGLFIRPVCAARGFDTGPFSLQISLGALAMLVAFPLAGRLMKKFPIKPLLLVCITVQAGVFILNSQFTQLWMFYVASPLQGLACVIPGFVMGPLLISNWFEKRRGLVMGAAMSCVGIFGAMFSVVGGILISHLGYQAAYVILGASAALLMLPAVFFCVLHPSMENRKAYGAQVCVARGQETEPQENAGLSKAKALRSGSFQLMFFTLFVMVCAGAFSPQITGLAMWKGFPVHQAGSFAGVFMVGCLLGSFLLGWLNDQVGVRNSTVAALLLGALSVGVIFASGASVLLLATGLILFGATCSAAGIQPPLLVTTLFGEKEYIAIYGVMQMALSLGGVLATPAYGFVFDAYGTFDPALIVVIAALLFCVPLTFLAFQIRPKITKREGV